MHTFDRFYTKKMKFVSDLLLIFLACSVLWATQGLAAIHAASGSSEYYEPDPFTCRIYPDIPSTMTSPVSPPQFPFFPLTNGSPPTAIPSTYAAEPTEIQSCESQLHYMEACFQDILGVFLANKLSLGPASACCKSIPAITQGCLDGLIPPYITDLFVPHITQLCSSTLSLSF